MRTMPAFDVIGMMPAMIGYLDPGQVAALAEVVEVPVVEEELRADVVGPGVHLPLQVLHLQEPVRGRRVPLREAGDADAEAAAGPEPSPGCG